MQNQRNYSYDEGGDTYGHQLAIQHGNTYSSSTNFGHQSTYGHHPNGQYYVSNQHSTNTTGEADQGSQNYGNHPSPAIQYGSRYQTEHGGDPRYYPSQGYSSIPYGSQSSHYGSHYNTAADQRTQPLNQSTQFIPTPSQTYANYSRHMGNPQSSGRPPESYVANHDQGLPRGSLQQSARPSSSSRSRTGTEGSPPSGVGERFPCEKCGKTFSRSHDRKRHHETQHLTTPVMHRCQYCEKEFSRADSLKRHLDNGCDEMP